MSGAGAEFVMPDDLHLPPMFLHRSVNVPVTGREPKAVFPVTFGLCELEEEPARSTTYGLCPASL